jgi:hypothetical protein
VKHIVFSVILSVTAQAGRQHVPSVTLGGPNATPAAEFTRVSSLAEISADRVLVADDRERSWFFSI